MKQSYIDVKILNTVPEQLFISTFDICNYFATKYQTCKCLKSCNIMQNVLLK